MNKKVARDTIKVFEQMAKDRYTEDSDWNEVIDMLNEVEKKELNEAYKKCYGEEYPTLKKKKVT